jgi:hypothetical protein
MPSDDRLRFHQEQRFTPAGPEARQHHPIDAIGWAQLDSAPPMLALKNEDLVAEGEELGFQVGPTANDVPDSTEQGNQSSDHRSTLAQLHAEGKLLASQPRMEFSEGTGSWKAVSDLTTRAGPLPSVTALSVDPAAPSTLYAGLAHGGVFAIQQAAVCVGDCGGTQTVAITDLITLVNIALGTAELAACPNGLPGDVDITTILQAVNNALNGCPS